MPATSYRIPTQGFLPSYFSKIDGQAHDLIDSSFSSFVLFFFLFLLSSCASTLHRSSIYKRHYTEHCLYFFPSFLKA